MRETERERKRYVYCTGTRCTCICIHMHMPHGSGCMPTSMDRIHCSLLGAHAPVPSLILSLSSLSDFPSRTVSLARSRSFAHARDERECARALLFCIPLFLSLALSFSLSGQQVVCLKHGKASLNTVCEPVEEVP